MTPVIKCPICTRDSFQVDLVGYKHWCLRAGVWVLWRAGAFKVPRPESGG